MRDLLSSSDSRHLSMVEYLFHEGRTHIQDLADAIGVSERVLRKDIKNFEKQYQSTELKVNHSIVTLNFPKGSSLDAFYCEILDESEMFQIIELIFFDIEQSTTDIANQLGLSSSTVYRLIQQFNQHVNQRYNVFVDYNPVRMVGNEFEVRRFYLEYFYEKYHFFDWPFSNINEMMVSSLIDIFTKIIRFPVSISAYRFGKFIVAINMTRVRQRFLVDVPSFKESLETLLQQMRNHEEYAALIQLYGEFLDIELSNDTLKQLFSPFTQKDYFYSESEYQEMTKNDPSIKKSFDCLDEIFDKLIHHYHIFLTNRDQLRLTMHNTYSQQRHGLMTPYILNHHAKKFVDLMHEYFPTFTNDVMKYMTEFQKTYIGKANELYTYDLVHTLFANWDDLYQELHKTRPRVKILILSDVLSEYGKIIKDTLKEQLAYRVHIDICDRIDLTLDELKESPHHMIISNFSLPPIPNKEIIIVQNFITEDDIYNIHLALESILQRFDQIIRNE